MNRLPVKIGARGHVEDDLRIRISDGTGEPHAVKEIRLLPQCAMFGIAGRCDIEIADLITSGTVILYQVGADEAGASGDKNSRHTFSSGSRGIPGRADVRGSVQRLQIQIEPSCVSHNPDGNKSDNRVLKTGWHSSPYFLYCAGEIEPDHHDAGPKLNPSESLYSEPKSSAGLSSICLGQCMLGRACQCKAESLYSHQVAFCVSWLIINAL